MQISMTRKKLHQLIALVQSRQTALDNLEIKAARGQIAKVIKDKNRIVSREVLTSHWTDWIDYWTVDFDFESKREIVRIEREPADQGDLPGLERPRQAQQDYEEVWAGDFIFENEWQSFRTKKD